MRPFYSYCVHSVPPTSRFSIHIFFCQFLFSVRYFQFQLENAKNGKKADEEEEYNEPEEPKNVQHNVPTIHADDENDEPRTGLRPPMDNVSTAHSYERSTGTPLGLLLLAHSFFVIFASSH
jgi:hypothetical protein